MDEQDYQELAGLPANTAIQSYRRVERIMSVIVLILVTLLLTAAASEFWSLSMLLQSGYSLGYECATVSDSLWALRGPNRILVCPSGLK